MFMKVENQGDEDLQLPTALEMRVEDTTGAEFEPIETDSIFALELGGVVEAGGEVPDAEHRRGQRPRAGLDRALPRDPGVSKNRPLDLIILAEGEEGIIELDI